MYYGRKGLPLTAISVIDLALWDLVGKLRNEPVYKMIGGSTRESIDFYCTGPEPAHAKKNGFWGGKVPLPFCPEEGAEGLRKNVEFLRKHRESVGPDFPLMVDCYMSLNVSYTIDLVKACNDLELNISWWEECLSPDDSAGFELIKRAHPQVKFTTGEHEYSRYGFRELIQSRNLDIIQPDVMWCGGLTELLKIANMAAAYDIPVVPHASGAYSYHYAAAQSKAVVPFCEYLANSPDGKSVMPVFGDLCLNEAMPINGKMAMSTLDKPGFGLELNPKANLINARMLLMPDPERPLGGGTSAGSASPIPKATSGRSTIPIPSAGPVAAIPSAAANAASFLSEKAANVASTLTESIKDGVPEVAAAKTESAPKPGQVPAITNRERRQSARDPEQARDDTKATIDVLRMRDAAQ